MTVEYVEYRAKRVLNVYKRPDANWFWTRYTAAPYIGCEHACEYCYARADKFLHFDDIEDFSRTIKVKTNAPKLLRKDLKGKEIDVITTGDWQPAEERYGLSREMLKVVKDLGFPLHVIEKSDLLLRDLDILKEINDRTWCCVSFSLSTADDEMAALLEPGAPAPSKRLKAIETLSDNGILTGVTYMPIVPFLTDSEEMIRETIVRSREAGASYALASSMTLSSGQRERFYRFLDERFPGAKQTYEEVYAGRYSPGQLYTAKLMRRVHQICVEEGMPQRIERPEFSRISPDQLSLGDF